MIVWFNCRTYGIENTLNQINQATLHVIQQHDPAAIGAIMQQMQVILAASNEQTSAFNRAQERIADAVVDMRNAVIGIRNVIACTGAAVSASAMHTAGLDVAIKTAIAHAATAASVHVAAAPIAVLSITNDAIFVVSAGCSALAVLSVLKLA